MPTLRLPVSVTGQCGLTRAVPWRQHATSVSSLEPGNRIVGPALVLQYDSTVLLAPGWTASVDAFGNLLCEKRETHA